LLAPLLAELAGAALDAPLLPLGLSGGPPPLPGPPLHLAALASEPVHSADAASVLPVHRSTLHIVENRVSEGVGPGGLPHPLGLDRAATIPGVGILRLPTDIAALAGLAGLGSPLDGS